LHYSIPQFQAQTKVTVHKQSSFFLIPRFYSEYERNVSLFKTIAKIALKGQTFPPFNVNVKKNNPRHLGKLCALDSFI